MPERIVGTRRVEALECVRTELVAADDGGRARPSELEGSEHGIPCDQVAVAADIVREHGGIFTGDGVQTGFGRTGSHGCGIEHWGVRPEIVTVAKGIANGLPVAATVARVDVADGAGPQYRQGDIETALGMMDRAFAAVGWGAGAVRTMARLTLIHWHAADAAERATTLRRAGHRVTVFSSESGAKMRELWRRPPEAFVIDLSRVPSRGRDLALVLRERRATRSLPIVFVGGDPAKVEALRFLIPEAEYASWRAIRGAVRRALKRPVPALPARGVMAGYSGTPLVKKLGLRAGSRVMLLGAPPDFERALVPRPEGVRFQRSARGEADLVIVFATSISALERGFGKAAAALAAGGSVWIAWPKQSSRVDTDLTQRVVRAFGLQSGFVDYKIAAIDAVWSGLRFARRARSRRRR